MKKLQTIFIEAGHGKSWWGGNDVGAVRGKVQERTINKLVCQELMNILNNKSELLDTDIQGVGVQTDAKINDKTKYVNSVIKENNLNKNECLVVSIHCNAERGTKAQGTETWSKYDALSVGIGTSICKSIVKYFKIPNRGNKKTRFYNYNYDCSASLVEMAFISNSFDRANLLHTNRMAEAIANGILEYLRKH